jgi:hypothetical protein
MDVSCMESDSTCYCTKFRKCFPYNQTIEISNCDIDKYSGPEFRLVLELWVTNMAGIESSMRSVEVSLLILQLIVLFVILSFRSNVT